MNLFLYEEIMLLAIRDDKGTFAADFIEYSVAGAVLAELLIKGKISISDDKTKKVTLIDDNKLSDPVIDECIELIAGLKKPTAMKSVMTKIAYIKKLKHKVATQLCNRKILRADENKILFIFTQKTYPEINPEPEQQILARMSTAIFDDNNDITPRTLVLIALANSAHLLEKNLPKDKLKENKKRIQQLVKGELVGYVTKEVIAACETAALMAAIMPAILSTVIVTTS